MSFYFNNVNLCEDKICFVAEDDLFIANIDGTEARRIVSNIGVISDPVFFPDGRRIAFRVLAGSNINEIYTCGTDGSKLTQVTFFGSFSTGIAGWKGDKELIIYSDINEANRGSTQFYSLNTETKIMGKENLGYGHRVQYSQQGILVGRNTFEVPYWKNYRGGTRGKLWYLQHGKQKFKKILEIETNIHSPYLFNNKIYFVTDLHGTANIYSYDLSKSDIERLTNFEDYDVRTMGHNGEKLIFTVGGEIWLFSISDSKLSKIQVDINPLGKKDRLLFLDATTDLEKIRPFSEESLGIIIRGRGVIMGKNRTNPVYLNRNFTGRIRDVCELDEKNFAVVQEIDGEDGINIYDSKGNRVKSFSLNLGILMRMMRVPKSQNIVVSNNRNQLFLINLESGEQKLIDKSDASRLGDFDVSNDGKLVAYAFKLSNGRSQIRLCSFVDMRIYEVTSTTSQDRNPSFDRSGKYLNFISNRNLDPTYDEFIFSLGFMTISKPYCVCLNSKLADPFIGSHPKFEESKEEVVYDFEGIDKRIQPYPLETGNYEELKTATGKIYYVKYKVEGAMKYYSLGPRGGRTGTLMEYNLSKREERTVMDGINFFAISEDGEKLLIQKGGKYYLTSLDLKPEDHDLEKLEIKLNSINAEIQRSADFKQMFNETWKFMREGYWKAETLKNWDSVRDKYSKLLDKIQTRSELSDLLKKTQGELGTSHSYEISQKLSEAKYYSAGKLGAVLEDTDGSGVRISRILRGDLANEGEKSSLEGSGLTVVDGDVIIGAEGAEIHTLMELHRILLNKNEDLITLKLKRKDGGIFESTVKLMTNQRKLAYRDWVETKRKYVHNASKGKCGYIHIPDMGPYGYSEFFRLFIEETKFQNLIVDVRYNGGGHVSQLLLDMLARKPLGSDINRWGEPEPYPSYSVSGNMICVTNEFAGSDGDIFSHSWKLMKLGELVGTRTWGGVVGINPIATLIDGTIVTQPEYAFHFNDVGYGVENYGTDPTVEVEISPDEFAEGDDVQLKKALEIVLK